MATFPNASLMVLTCDVLRMNVTLGLVASLPIQLNCAALYLDALAPSVSSSGIVGDASPSVVPSLGAALKRWLAARMLPAPGMFRTITDGLPGIYFPM